jgi:D-amino peptidase
VVLVTGDDLTCVDARGYAPEAVGVAVKTCIDRYSAICLPPAVSAAAITEGAARALRSARPAAPRQPPDGGHTWQITFDAAHLAPWATYVPGVDQLDERTVRYTLPTVYQGIRCFRALTRLVTTGIEPTYG